MRIIFSCLKVNMTERELLKTVGNNIKRHRTGFRWPQAELAEKINISINFLSDIETGKKWPSPVTMVKLAEVFRIEAYELFKPPGVLPDDSRGLLNEYTETLCQAIETVRASYVERMRG
ncbi:MAG: hypothetical protein Pg6C_07910 [Treponemataceae bacterium]|nr:MAG: hypothetical protein Pg6C_07910 [Treponemataceae bacterium]